MTEAIRELDCKLDAAIGALPLLTDGVRRSRAVLHLLRYLEDYARIYSHTLSEGQSPDYHHGLLKQAQDGIHYALKWVYQQCEPDRPNDDLRTRKQTYVQAKELHDSAMQYSAVWDLMAMLFRDRATAEIGDGIVTVRYANQVAADCEVADRYISSPDPPDRQSCSDPHLAELLSRLAIRPAGSEAIHYTIAQDVYDAVSAEVRERSSHLWELDSGWDLGGVTVSDVREFWVAVRALCELNSFACMASGVKGLALNSVVMYRSSRDWRDRISHLSGLSPSKVSLLLADHTYDHSLYAGGAKEPDITYQPFFPLRDSLLSLSSFLVTRSNYERNYWDLLSIIRPRIHSTVRNLKEGKWLGELKPFLRGLGLAVAGPVPHANGDTDLLLLDRARRSGVVCQLKWLTSPDRVRDVAYTEKELAIGIEQAKASMSWIRESPSGAAQALGVAVDEIRCSNFSPIVLSKNTIGSGWIDDREVPISNERLLRWVLSDPHRQPLHAWWTVCRERRYLPKRPRHFEDLDLDVEFAGIRFIGKDMAMVPRDTWRPDRDIDLAGIA